METKICKRTPANDPKESNACHEAQSLTFDKYVRRGYKQKNTTNKKKNRLIEITVDKKATELLRVYINIDKSFNTAYYQMPRIKSSEAINECCKRAVEL